MLRLWLLVLALAFVVTVPFLIWGAGIEAAYTIDTLVEHLRESGWGGLAGVGLIASDIALPVPSTAAMAALGILYGPLVGGLLAGAGSMLAGCLGYWLCRAIGPGIAVRLAGETGIAEARRLFGRWGFWLVAGSRWVPVLPETVAFLAGLVRMPFGQFVGALACGAIPLGFVFATAGHIGREAPVPVMILCAVAPLVIAALVRHLRG